MATMVGEGVAPLYSPRWPVTAIRYEPETQKKVVCQVIIELVEQTDGGIVVVDGGYRDQELDCHRIVAGNVWIESRS